MLPNVRELTRARPVRSGSATHSVAMSEPRKRRAKRRPCVGCCEELARPCSCLSCRTALIVRLITACRLGRAVELLPKHAKHAPLRAESEEQPSQNPPCAGAWRAREPGQRPVWSARRHTNLLTQRELRPTQIVQPAEGKRVVAQSQT